MKSVLHVNLKFQIIIAVLIFYPLFGSKVQGRSKEAQTLLSLATSTRSSGRI